jgi:thimet oligopeptidase
VIEGELSPQHLREQARAALAEARAAARSFAQLPADASSEALAAAFDGIQAPLDGVQGAVHLMGRVHPDAAVRAAADEAEQELAAFQTELSLDRGVHARLNAAPLPADPLARRLVEHALRDYRRSGVDRAEPERVRIRALNEELVKTGQEFDRNIISLGRSLRIPEGHEGLRGLPADFIAAHPQAADGSVELTTDAPERVPFLTYAERADLRRAYYRVHLNRAAPENLPVLRRLLNLRQELAGLLGYGSWADYVTEDKMVRSARAARDFVERVLSVAQPRARAEYAELLDELRREDPAARIVRESDRLYLVERAKQRRFGFDSQSVRPYFPYERVRDGVLATSAALYGLSFRKRAEARLWHPSVECYELCEGGRAIALLYLDMHPRADKYKHAAMFDLRARSSERGLAAACLVCNFPEPKAGDPALLLHEQVSTFFHEFGHLLHHLFGAGQRYLRFSGIATEWDFVEVPSQMYEEWASDVGVLQSFARHWQTDEPIPSELVARMRQADEYGKALHVVQQMFYARLALDYHEGRLGETDLLERMLAAKRESLPFPHEEGTYFHASFGHLNGYSAMYYTYMWSLAIAKELYASFGGRPMDGVVARRYRERVLAPGGTSDAAQLVRDFLGRDSGLEALEGWLRSA